MMSEEEKQDQSIIPSNLQGEQLRVARRYVGYRLMTRNMENILQALNKAIIQYRDWCFHNEELLKSSLETQSAGVKVLSNLSRMNQETTNTFMIQEDIDLALEQLKKEIMDD